MADKTKIQWAEASWNPIIGCSKVSPGCQNCYAEKMAHCLGMICQASIAKCKYENNGQIHQDKLQCPQYCGITDGGKWTGKVSFVGGTLKKPLHWKKPRRIFVCSMGDLFHESVEFDWITAVVNIARKCSRHTFIFLTKREQRMYEYSKYINFDWPDNILGMVTIENQEMADKRVPWLLKCGFKRTGVSVEPMLSAVDIYTEAVYKCECGFTGDKLEESCSEDWEEEEHFLICPTCKNRENDDNWHGMDSVDWVIIGAESGANRRFLDSDYALALVKQCRAAGVPVFVKQLHDQETVKLIKSPEGWPREYPKEQDNG